jgi:hypothetical protein
MIQIALYESYKGKLLFDFTFTSKDTEFSTNKYGFGYARFSISQKLDDIQALFSLKSVGYIFIGTAVKTYFEGRLEDIEIQDQFVTLTSFGYWRAFSDLQVNDLWSTTDLSAWQIIEGNIRGRPESYATENTGDTIKFSLQKNTLISGGTFTGAYLYTPSQSRLLDTIDLKYGYQTPSANSAVGVQRIVDRFTPYAANPNTYALTSSLTVTSVPVTATNMQCSGILLFFSSTVIPGTLFIGETGSFFTAFSGIRVGTTSTISGGRLYADEIMRYTLSGVYSLNPAQINPSTLGITSPLYDLKDVWFKDNTALEVVDFLLQYPDSQGNQYDFKIWENRQVYFKRKISPRTWYITLGSINVSRTLKDYYNTINSRYTDTLRRNQIAQIRTSGGVINRQKSLDVNTDDPNLARSAAQANLADIQRKPPQSDIEISKVQDSSGAIWDAYEVRTGDTIVIRDIPVALFALIDNTFIVAETISNLDTGITRLIPEKPLPYLDTLLSKVKL